MTEAGESPGNTIYTDEDMSEDQFTKVTTKGELASTFKELAGVPIKELDTLEGNGAKLLGYDMKHLSPKRQLEIVTIAEALNMQVRSVTEGMLVVRRENPAAESIVENVDWKSYGFRKPAKDADVDLSVAGGAQIRGYDLIDKNRNQRLGIVSSAVSRGWQVRVNSGDMLVLRRQAEPKSDKFTA